MEVVIWEYTCLVKAKEDVVADPRRLRGHKGAATGCVASSDRPGLVVTCGEGMKISFTFPLEMKSRVLMCIW
ncbi:hypothetical protein F0562_018140 [Nyssa sinensis]|uniref:Uncharacterized protein n=1 Tax=Nyssa sinensis TaxID=561372 RepID=A0A5J4Z8N9_9ASTE|nr:hypothetical protein F0562_018140 [Nyssa sinensis]